MPPRPKSARLWFRPTRYDSKGKHGGAYFILDQGRQIATGTDQQDEAEKALAGYLTEKHLRDASSAKRDPSRIPVADVIALYARDIVGSEHYSDPIAAKTRLARLLDFFGAMMLSQINGALCRRYWEHSTTFSMARRDLEDLRAAINHHRSEGPATEWWASSCLSAHRQENGG